MTSRIPSRQTLAGFGDVLIRVPMDGEGNATVENNLSVGGNTLLKKTLDVGATGHFRGDVIIDGELDVANLVISGSELIDGSLTVKGDVRATSFTTGVTGLTGGNITCVAPGRFVGDGSGLTNLPVAPPIPITGAFSFTSTGIPLPLVNRMNPESIEIVPFYVQIPCEMFGKPPGLYFWKTSTNILLQQLFNSASGYVFWDGTKVSGHTTWSLTQDDPISNPFYSLTWSYLFSTSLTGFYVQIESSNGSVAGLTSTYTVTFYLIAPISS
jgi:hypothetical protein